MKKHPIAALAAVLFATTVVPSLALAAEPAPTPLDPVVVTATRTPTLVSTVNAAVTVIDREQLSLLQGADLGDALSLVAGIDVIRSGGPGQSPLSVGIRGAGAKHTLVLIDGVPYRDGINSLSSIENLPLESIERIEIVKGPRSAQWGADALGGVINIITRAQSQQGFHGELMARAGRYDSQDYTGRLGYRNAEGGLSLTLEQQDSDGYAPRTDSALKAGHENLAATLAGDVQIGVNRFSLSHLQADGSTEYVNSAFDTQPSEYDFSRRTSRLAWARPLLAHWSSTLALQLGGDSRDEQQLGFGTAPDYYHTERRALDWQNDIDLGANQITAGLNYIDEDTEASVSDSTFDESTLSKAAFVQDALRLGAFSALGALRYTNHDSFGGHTTGAIDLGYDLTSDITAGIGYGTAFRAPDASERFLEFPAFGSFANPDLDPETSRNLEASIKARLGQHQTLALHAFENKIKNLIAYQTDANFNSRPVNISKAKISGVELDYQLALGAWALGLNGSLQKPKDETTGERLLRRSSKSATANLTRRLGEHRVGLNLQGVGDRDDVTFDPNTFARIPVKNGGYALVNLTGELKLPYRLSLSAKVENLLDKDYVTVYGYRQTGRAAYGTLRWSF